MSKTSHPDAKTKPCWTVSLSPSTKPILPLLRSWQGVWLLWFFTRALPHLFSRLFLPPDVQILSIAAISEKPKAGYLMHYEFFILQFFDIIRIWEKFWREVIFFSLNRSWQTKPANFIRFVIVSDLNSNKLQFLVFWRNMFEYVDVVLGLYIVSFFSLDLCLNNF